MKAPVCCQPSTGRRGSLPGFPPRWSGEIVGWLIPGMVLALLPKCPLCVAGYVTFFTGMGMSLPTAASLRVVLVTLCVGTWIFLAVRRIGVRRGIR